MIFKYFPQNPTTLSLTHIEQTSGNQHKFIRRKARKLKDDALGIRIFPANDPVIPEARSSIRHAVAYTLTRLNESEEVTRFVNRLLFPMAPTGDLSSD